MNWPEQIRIRNQMTRQDAELAAARDARPTAPPARDWFAAAAEQARQAETERLERDRKISAAHQARMQQQAEARQQMGRDWGIIRGQLRDRVAELQQQVASAEAKTNSADDAEAQAGILELAVAERRLAAAQRDFAGHMSRMP